MALRQFKNKNDLIKKEIEEIKAEILNKFLQNARKLKITLQILEENNGVDDERYICIEGAEVEAEIEMYYTIIDAEFFEIAKAILGKMTTGNALSCFEELLQHDGWGKLIEYEEFYLMVELSDTYENYTLAEQAISW